MRHVFVVVCLLASVANAQSISLFRAGPGSGAEFKKAGRTGWFALYRNRLVAAKLEVTPWRHPIDDDGKPDSVKTGVEVKLTGEEKLPLVLIRGMKPRAGLVAVSPDAESTGLYEFGKPVALGQGASVTTKVADGGARLELRVGEQTQTLFASEESDVDGWSLRWAGDLDGDGKLDLLITADTHYAIETFRLFLSTRAKKGQLVGEAAKLTSQGC
ncbi:MAG: FG-GAP repeat protein [Archangium sp.]